MRYEERKGEREIKNDDDNLKMRLFEYGSEKHPAGIQEYPA